MNRHACAKSMDTPKTQNAADAVLIESQVDLEPHGRRGPLRCRFWAAD